PGVPGVSENIRVRSIVGRFLEHSRVYCFENAGERELFLASADWMERNFFRRVEIAFPVLKQQPRERILKDLEIYLADNINAWELQSDGSYRRSSACWSATRGCRRRRSKVRLSRAGARIPASAAPAAADSRSPAADRRRSAGARAASGMESVFPACANAPSARSAAGPPGCGPDAAAPTGAAARSGRAPGDPRAGSDPPDARASACGDDCPPGAR